MSTDQTNALDFRVRITTATMFVKYLEIKDEKRKVFLGSFYGKSDVERWARNSINDILKVAFEIDLSSEDQARALNAVYEPALRLDRVGYKILNMRQKQKRLVVLHFKKGLK